jgi:hypothetical protein
MKFTPLNHQPNISNIGFESASPSMQLDSRGFPHISWLDKKQGHNAINYRFWDGLKWSQLEDSIIDRSEEEIINSNNSIILENDSPILAFSKRDVNGSLLTVTYQSEGEWIKSQLSVDYDTKWIGIVALIEGLAFLSSSSSSGSSLGYSTSSSSSSSSSSSNRHSSSSLGYSTSSSSSSSSWYYSTSSSSSSLQYSTSSSSSSQEYSTSSSSISSGDSSSSSSNGYSTSSSSSSLGHSTSSSSSGEYSTSSSSNSSSSLSSVGYSTSSSSSSSGSSVGYSSSSSSLVYSTSSSSSSGSESSSSSSSLDNGNMIVCTLDSDGELRIYKWSKSRGWSYIIGFTSPIVDYSTFKISSTNDVVGLAYLKDDSIYYNFFDVNSGLWSFIDFDSVAILNEDIIDFDADAYNNEHLCVLSLAWLSDSTNNFYVRHINVDSDGNQGVDDSSNTIVHARAKTVQSDTYIVNGFNSISVFNDAFKKPNILASGAETIFYYKDSVWGIDEVDINGSCDGFVPSSCNIMLDYEDNVKFSFGSNGGIYYFEQSEDDGFDMSSPSLVILNANNLFLTKWECGNLIGDELSCIYKNKSGDILRESLKKVVVVVNETYDPVCESSSSESSESEGNVSSSSSSSTDGI